MNKSKFEEIIKENNKFIENRIGSLFEENYMLTEPILYALDGGKRVRPNLFIETMKMLGQDIDENVIDFALALEMIHAYSLVHDDLPAMDNDMTRRGQPTVHAKFGEDVAILTGDALLNRAASLLFEISLRDSSYLESCQYLLGCSGYKGMIEGQMLDLSAEDYDIDYIIRVYEKKTGDLFRAGVVGAGLASGLDRENIIRLETYGKNLGIAFQIQDDLLEEDYENEVNILNIVDRDYAEDMLKEANEKAKLAIESFDKNDFLLYMVEMLTRRRY